MQFAQQQDIGQDPTNPLTRLYATHAAQPFHNDSADIVTLLCLKNAKSGANIDAFIMLAVPCSTRDG